MADRLTSDELEKMQKSVKDMTDLSRNLRSEFTKIKNTTDLLSTTFKNIIKNAGRNLNIAEKYLIAQKTSNVLSEKINELKSKSSYLDSVSLKFKEEETKLQVAIAAAQIRALESQISMANINKEDRERAINNLKIQNVLRETELDYFQKNSNLQNNIISQLETQKSISDTILNNIELTGEGVINTDSFMGALKGSFNFLAGRTGLIVKDLGNLGKLIADSSSSGAFLAKIIETGYLNFKAFDKAATSVRSTLGSLPGEVNNLERLIKEVGVDTMYLGASFDDVATSITSITKEFTALVAGDRDLLQTTIALSKQFGITQDISVKFLKTLGGISGTSTSSQKSMTGFAQKLAQASGVPLGKLMEDVANASDETRLYTGSSASSLIKAAAAARSMGIDLAKAANSASKLLDFESSITSELKASALLGQNVNFNYARQLAFSKDIIGANQEILKIAKQVRFNQLNPIQQKAFADAAGKSVGELQDMLTQEKNMQLVANSTNKDVRKRYEEYQKLMQLKQQESEDAGKTAEREFLQRANQEKLLQLQNKFNQLMSELAEPVMEVLDAFLTIATAVLPYIKLTLIPILGFIKPISTYVVNIGTYLTTWGRAMSIFGTKVLGIGKIIGSIAKFGGVFLKLFGTKIPVIGQIISALLFIRNYVRDIKRMFDEGGTWGEMIIKGLLLIPKAIIEAFLPFDSVKKKLDEWFFGKSPSKAGKLIAKGFSSIGPELQDSLTAPINSAYKNIENMSPPSVSIETKNAENLKTKADTTLIDTIQSGNQQLAAKLDQLMSMMSNGGIAVNLDGQRVSATLARTTYRSGGFGQSTSNA